MARRRNLIILALVLALLAGSALVITDKRTVLGLDLRGGTELVYQARPTPANPNIDPDDIQRAIEIIRDRTDALGVSEPEIAQGAGQDGTAAPDARPGAALRRLTFSIAQRGALYSLEDVVEETGADPRLVQELEDFGIVRGEQRGGPGGVKYFDETEREIVRSVSELARYGVAGRNLRVFKTSAEREAALLQQILAPALRSRNPERRKEALEALENLAAVASHLKHLLLIRDLRKIAG